MWGVAGAGGVGGGPVFLLFMLFYLLGFRNVLVVDVLVHKIIFK